MVTTITDTYRTTPNTTFFIDINAYSGACDFTSLKNDGVKQIYLRAYGSDHSGTGDKLFEQFIPYARGVKLPLGAYYYAMPKDSTLADAKLQADQFIAKMKGGFGNYGDLIPMLDVEDNSTIVGAGQPSTISLSVSDLLTWINNFRNYFEDTTGVRLGLYTDGYFVKDQRNNFNEGRTPEGNIIKDMPVWFAGYTRYGVTQCPQAGGFQNVLAWQYSDQAVFAGIPSNKVDVSLAYAPMTSQKVVMVEEVISNTATSTNTIQGANGVTVTTTTITTTSHIEKVKTYQ
jgi:GH25 family lysozyme M1 (1,4-beta-N-acetylmuramidase)